MSFFKLIKKLPSESSSKLFSCNKAQAFLTRFQWQLDGQWPRKITKAYDQNHSKRFNVKLSQHRLKNCIANQSASTLSGRGCHSNWPSLGKTPKIKFSAQLWIEVNSINVKPLKESSLPYNIYKLTIVEASTQFSKIEIWLNFKRFKI